MATGSQRDLQIALSQYSDNSVLANDYEGVQPSKCSRISTSSTCSISGVAKSPSNIFDLYLDIWK